MDSGAKVINISLAGGSGGQVLSSAVAYALQNGSLIFAGAGNSAEDGNPVMYPAATAGVVAVGTLSATGYCIGRRNPSMVPRWGMAAPGEDMVEGMRRENRSLPQSRHQRCHRPRLRQCRPHLVRPPRLDDDNEVLRVMLNTIGGPTDGAKRNDAIGYGIVRPRIALTNPGDPGPRRQVPAARLPGRSLRLTDPEHRR